MAEGSGKSSAIPVTVVKDASVEGRQIVASDKTAGPDAGFASHSELAKYKKQKPRAPTVAPNEQAWPPNIENQISEYFSQLPGLALTSLSSVECSDTQCEIWLTGMEVNPGSVEQFMDFRFGMYAQGWNVQQSNVTLLDIAPGARAYVLKISNVKPDQVDAARRRRSEPLESNADMAD